MKKLILALTLSAACSPVLADRDQLPHVSDWQHHYLVLQGENFLPVVKAYATPNATFFVVEPDYLPSEPLTLGAETSDCLETSEGKGRSVTDSGGARVTLKAEAAEAHAGESARRQSGCLREMGLVQAGSYVYDATGNQLAGQDFSDPTRLMMGEFRLHSDYEDDIENFLVIPEGGEERKADPGIKMLDYGTAIIADYPLPPGNKTKIGVGKNYAPGAPELPVTVSYDLAGTVDSDDLIRAPIDDLLTALEDALQQPQDDTEEVRQALIVARVAEGAGADDFLERVDAIRKAVRESLGPAADIRTAVLNDQAPICSDDSLACHAINLSTLVYLH